jgi:DNA gyrase/topoisomerase IV subunit B
MDRKPYTVADLTVLTFEEAVRNRPGMYFPTEPDSLGLPAGILQGVIGDALHAADGSNRPVDVEITSGPRFTVTDDQPPDR